MLPKVWVGVRTGQGRYDAYNVIRHELTRHLTEEFRM